MTKFYFARIDSPGIVALQREPGTSGGRKDSNPTPDLILAKNSWKHNVTELSNPFNEPTNQESTPAHGARCARAGHRILLHCNT